VKKFFALIVFATFLCCLTFANNDITPLPQSIDGIGAVQEYQTGKNTYVGINLNLEMLYIATETGSGFTHPAYTAANEIAETVKSYYHPFQNNKYAQKFNKLSQKSVNIPRQNFPNQITSEVLSYGQILSPDRVFKGHPGLLTINIKKDLRHFYDETASQQFWVQNLPKYNEMTANFVAQYGFDYVAELEDFFGATASQDKFEILLTPLYNGGSALAVENPDKTMTYISIINPFLGDFSVTDLIIHENTHNFLGPILNKNHTLIHHYQKYLKPSFGNAQGFVKNDSRSFLNELLARAVTLATLDKYHSPDLAYESWINEKAAGWDELDAVYALIKNKYLAQRDKYPRFEDFLPVILEYFKAKSSGQIYDIGPKALVEQKEIKAARVDHVYWEGDSRIAGLKAKEPHSLLLEVEFSPMRNPVGKLVGEFFDKAGSEFQLVSEGKPAVTARPYEGTVYMVNGITFWGIWALIPDTEFSKLEPGVIYKLVPKKQNPDYPWLIDENATIIISIPKKDN
jgi:hypothetical protein